MRPLLSKIVIMCVHALSLPLPSQPHSPTIAFDHGKQMTGYSPVYTYRASVLFECEHRYTLKGSNVLQCNENSRWDPQLPVCERKIRCSSPNITNGRVRSRKATYVYEDKIRIECNSGYALKDHYGLIKCERNGAWHPPLPICEPVGCQQISGKRGEKKLVKAGVCRG
uniref:Sushi domain-containing protein n=1 Tax=Terrapene triunguis TaxID=2587831 RepID=A0A674IM00_9SAUR